MRKSKPYWIVIGACATIGIHFIVNTSTAIANDERTAVVLESTERQMILGKMRDLLQTTQMMVEALANEDVAEVTRIARSTGHAATKNMDATLKAKFPTAFKAIGSDMHDGFDHIADMAQAGKPLKAMQQQLAATMNNCVACHASYRLVEVNPVTNKY